MTDRRILPGLLSAVAGGLCALLAAGPVHAQYVISGFARSDQTDVSHVAVTSGDLLDFEPGTVKSFTCSVAWGVRTSAAELARELVDGRLDGPDGAPIPTAAQSRLFLLLTDAPGDGDARARLVAALTPPGNASPAARRAARQLARRLEDLLAVAERMDPERPGHLAATQTTAAVTSYNRFVDASAPAFLDAPPPELRAVRAVLSRMVIAALENEDREVAPAADGCPPPPAVEAAAVAAPPPPPETAIAVCVLRDAGPVEVAAVLRPTTGDTLAIVAGERRPFREVHPATAPLASAAAWFAEEVVEVHGERYRRYGLPRVMAPGTLARAGDYRGVPLYTAPGAGNRPGAVYLPTAAGCELQEYRRAEEVSRVRG